MTTNLLEYSKTYKPFRYEWAVKYAEEHEQIHWIHQEADLSGDVRDWHNNLPPVAKNLFHQIMKLFTQSDAQVAQNYIDFLLPTFKNNEIRQMLLAFAAREGIHQRAYAAILETLNLPDSEFEAFLDYKEMFDKIEFWKLNDVHSLSGKALAVAKNIFAEGVSLFGSFIMLMNYQRYGLMLGTSEINRWSCLDEQIHRDGLIKLFRTFCEEHPRIVNDDFKKQIYDIARATYDLEEKFIDLAFGLGELDLVSDSITDPLTKEDVKTYIKYLCDRALIEMGLKGNFKVKTNPLPWFDLLLGTKEHANFFEAKVTDYQKGGMLGEWDKAW